MALFIPMTIFVRTADVGFVYLDNAAKLFDVLHKRDADFVAHAPRGFVRAKAHVAHDLQRAHAILAGEHEVGNLEPVAKRLVRVLEDRARNVREAVAVWRTFFALPVPFARRQIVNRGVAAARATNALRPAARHQVGPAGIFVGEKIVEFSFRKLVNRLGTFCHGTLPTGSVKYGIIAFTN